MMLGAPALVSAAFKYFDPTKTGEIPQLLSQTGFYANLANRTTDTAAKAFVVNSPLWSDGSLKKRWVILRPGRKIAWADDTDFFDYPDSTVFVKAFLHVRAPGDTLYWETRFLVKKADTAEGAQNWWGFSYRWNTAQTDANLVDPGTGANGVLSVKDIQGRTTYKKWRFPAQAECNRCHQVSSGNHPSPNLPVRLGRGVMGFYPAQLKRPTQNGASNQVLDLFAAGVFSGAQPNTASLARRFIGMAEAIDPTLTDSQRRVVVDNMSRSYLAANCSGCHGDRSALIGASAATIPPNFDYFDLRQHDLPFNQIKSIGILNDTSSYTDSLSLIQGRNKYKWLVSTSGLGSDPDWNLALPPGNPDTLTTNEIYIDPATKKGYPSLSYGLFRQWSRTTQAADSATWYRALKKAAGFGDANAQAKIAWMFSKPWGSQEWTDNLASHAFNLDSVMAGWSGVNLYRSDGDGMPPLATYIPDTAALKILGEWVAKQGASSEIGIRAIGSRAFPSPYIRDRILIVPAGFTGAVRMMDIRGRVFALRPLGNGRYEIPDMAKDGIYFLRVGQRFFWASLLR
jgi:cytochrome c553